MTVIASMRERMGNTIYKFLHKTKWRGSDVMLPYPYLGSRILHESTKISRWGKLLPQHLPPTPLLYTKDTKVVNQFSIFHESTKTRKRENRRVWRGVAWDRIRAHKKRTTETQRAQRCTEEKNRLLVYRRSAETQNKSVSFTRLVSPAPRI